MGPVSLRSFLPGLGATSSGCSSRMCSIPPIPSCEIASGMVRDMARSAWQKVKRQAEDAEASPGVPVGVVV